MQWPSDSNAGTHFSDSDSACTPVSYTLNQHLDAPFNAQDSDSTLPKADIPTKVNTVVSVSTTFHAQANIGGTPFDLIVISANKALFYVHRQRLKDASNNDFKYLLPSYTSDPSKRHPLVIAVDDTAAVINVVMHTLYCMSCDRFHPSLDILAAAIDSAIAYGLSPCQYVVPHQPLYQLLLSQAPYDPINFFSLAAAHGFDDLAVAISPHLLSFDLSSLTNELVKRMGAIYLRRLFFMHRGRMQALKRLLRCPPELHACIPSCNSEQQANLTREWALATAQISWVARPDLSVNVIQSMLAPLTQLACKQCKDALNARVEQLSSDWVAIKITI